MAEIAQVIERFPDIEWEVPMYVQVGPEHGWACRICIAENGLKGSEFEPMSRGDAIAHVERHLAQINEGSN